METHIKNTLPDAAENQPAIIIVTGVSGAGKTTLMGALEDLGFESINNLPLALLSNFLAMSLETSSKPNKIAICLDVRNEKTITDLMNTIPLLKQEGREKQFKIIYLNASDQTLLKRFQETRRNHPLAQGIPIDQAIQKEKRMLEPLSLYADITLDTDSMTNQEFRKWVRSYFAHLTTQPMLVNIVSFGFKYGAPHESNLVYDLRFLPNPHFIPALKDLTGKNKNVAEYLFQQSAVVDYWERLSPFLHYSLDRFYEEGRFFVTIALGCTGGKHRSVAFVERLATQSWDRIHFLVRHRDLGKE